MSPKKSQNSQKHLDILKSEPLSRTQIAQMAAVLNDFSPLYLDDPFANATGFGGVIAPGALAMTLSENYLRHFFKNSKIHQLDATFHKLIRPGDAISIQGEIKNNTLIELTARNQNGDPIMTAQAFFNAANASK